MNTLIIKDNTLITPETINFTELVKIGNTSVLNETFQSKMVTMLNQEFTDEEQRWYIANLYVYMNYHPTNDFPINLDRVFKMIGFANKGNAMKTIKSNFVVDEDYKVALFHTEKRKNEGGHNKEDIMLNIDTFKNLCMIAKTEKGKAIRKYYVKLENIYNRIIKEEFDEKDKLLENTQQNLIDTQKQLQKVSQLKIKKWYNIEPNESVYAYKNSVSNGNDKDKQEIKIGKAEAGVRNRETAYMIGNRSGDIFYHRKCHNSKLTEKVIHHMLDKHRIHSNKEWFDISEELAIYTIDIVCNFLDNFIDHSDGLLESNLKEYLLSSFEHAKQISLDKTPETPETPETHETPETPETPEIHINEDAEKNKKIIKKTNNITYDNEDLDIIKIKKFIEEHCEISPENKCLKIDMLGAYRLHIKSTNVKTRNKMTTYMTQNFKSERYYVQEYKTVISFYIGIRPKEMKIVQEKKDHLPYYEEFILSECKFGFTHRTTKSIIMTEFNNWLKQTYPTYEVTKDDKIHFESYLSRNFYNYKRIHINGGCNGYYGIQMKHDDSINIGLNFENGIKINKINIHTNKIVEVFKSTTEAAIHLATRAFNIKDFIKSKTIIDNDFLLQYADESKNVVKYDKELFDTIQMIDYA